MRKIEQKITKEDALVGKEDKEEKTVHKELSKCSNCPTEINEKVKHYSQDKFGKALCISCQDKERAREPKEEKKAKTDDPIAPKYIKLQGRNFVTHAGLLDEAHKKGLMKIETEVINVEKTDFKEGPVIIKATVNMTQKTGEKDKDGNKFYVHKQFTGIGDASKENVNSNVSKHIIRMGETRAINRALRLAVNIGMTSIDELEKTEEKREDKK